MIELLERLNRGVPLALPRPRGVDGSLREPLTVACLFGNIFLLLNTFNFSAIISSARCTALSIRLEKKVFGIVFGICQIKLVLSNKIPNKTLEKTPQIKYRLKYVFDVFYLTNI